MKDLARRKYEEHIWTVPLNRLVQWEEKEKLMVGSD